MADRTRIADGEKADHDAFLALDRDQKS